MLGACFSARLRSLWVFPLVCVSGEGDFSVSTVSFFSGKLWFRILQQSTAEVHKTYTNFINIANLSLKIITWFWGEASNKQRGRTSCYCWTLGSLIHLWWQSDQKGSPRNTGWLLTKENLIQRSLRFSPIGLITSRNGNHKITEHLRWEGTSMACLIQLPYSKQGELQQVAQGCVQSGFKFPRRRQLQNLSQQLAPVFNHPHSRTVFSFVQTKFLVFQFQPVAFSATWQCWEELGSGFFAPPTRYF